MTIVNGGWVQIEFNGKDYLYNPMNCDHMLQEYATARAFAESTAVVKTKETLLQKIGVMDPNAFMELDKGSAKRLTSRYLSSIQKKREAIFTGHYRGHGKSLVRNLWFIRWDTITYRKRMRWKIESVNEINNVSQQIAEKRIAQARAARDLAVWGFSVIAAVGTGGVSVAATAISAGGSAGSTFQDTGDVKKSLMSGAIALVPAGAGKVDNALKVAGKTAGARFATAVAIDTTAGTISNVVVKEQDIESALKKAATEALIGKTAGMASPQLNKKFVTQARDQVKRAIGNTYTNALAKRQRLEVASALELLDLKKKRGKAASSIIGKMGKAFVMHATGPVPPRIARPRSRDLEDSVWPYIRNRIIRPLNLGWLVG